MERQFETTNKKLRPLALAASIALAVGALWPAAAAADVSGQAAAVKATILGASASIADTGTLSGAGDAREASALAGSALSVINVEAPHATTIGYYDGSTAASEASLGTLSINVAGNSIGSDFVMSRVTKTASGTQVASSQFDGLSVNGMPIVATGQPNQTLYLAGAKLVINEQTTSGGSTVVNALHLIVYGVADVVVASARAGAAAAPAPNPLPLPLPFGL